MRSWIGTTLAALTFAAMLPAQAQSTPRQNAPPPAAPAAKPRVGYAGTPTPPPAPAQVQNAAPVYYYSPGGYVIYGAPYLVLSDGSVLVSFGNGYERVLRQCAPPESSNWPVNQTGRDALGRILDPPGIAALKVGARGQALGNAPGQTATACYRSDAQGRVEMVTTP